MGFLLSSFFFLVASVFCFTIPGVFLLTKSKQKFNSWEKVFLGTVIGFTIFTLLSYVLLGLKIHFLLLPIIAIIDFYFLRDFLKRPPDFPFLPKKQLFLVLIVFIIGILGQLAIIAPSGRFVDNDLVFWSAHGHDGPWHIALMEEIKKGYPLQNPIFAGEKLVNYHFFSDIAPTDFNKYLGFSSLDLYFRYFPFVFSLLLGTSAYFLGKKIGKSHQAGLWTAIFTYFAGSFGFIATSILEKKIGGENIFWASQIQSSSGNPPQIISNILVLTFLLLLLILVKKKDKVLFIISILIVGTLAVFKVYASVVVLAALGIVSIWQIVKERKYYLFTMFALSGLLSAILYLPNTSGSTSFLIFEPWWFIRTMIVEPSRLNWLDHELRRQTYVFEKNWKRVIFLEGIGFLIFFFGNLGMRFIGIYSFIKKGKTVHKNYFNLTFILIIVLSLALPLLFLQKGVAGNTSQFLQYFILLFGILAGLTTAKILDKIKPKFLKIPLAFLIILLSIPTQAGLLYKFYKRPALSKISKHELDALTFLKKNSKENEVILTPPYDQYLDLKNITPDVWDWSDTSYVSAFSARRIYFADKEQMDIMGYDFEERLEVQEYVFIETDPKLVKQKLVASEIDYLYFPKALAPKANLEKSTFSQIFENQKAEIWKVNKQ